MTPGPDLSALERGAKAVDSSHSLAMIGCGGISAFHLAAYRAAGYDVAVLCDVDLERARSRRDEYFPDADISDDVDAVLRRDDIAVVDIATHVDVRPDLVRRALAAGKHVLSQKPFVRDLEEGAELVRLADEAGRLLAVNQNGRWAPHHRFLLSAVRSGVIGEVSTADFALYWPHDEDVASSEVFSTMHDLIVYDFGIHWFDLVAQLFAGREALSVMAYTGRSSGQVIPVPTIATVVITFADGQASLLFRGSSHVAESGSYRVDGARGAIVHRGASLGGESATVTTAEGSTEVDLEGTWWSEGMHGTMAELLSALETGAVPSNAAATSLPGLALCFAAVESGRTGLPVDPRAVRRLVLGDSVSGAL